MSLSGRLTTMDLPEVLQWVTIGKKTGSLAFAKDKIKVFIYFKDGTIISSRSNDPTKQLGQFLLFQGKITEQDLKMAFEIHLKSRVILGKILVRENLVSQADVEAALRTRTAEVIYDLFLWEDGTFHFSSDPVKLDELIQIKMEINALLFEGIRRKDEWVRIRSIFPNNDTILTLRTDVDLKSLNLTPLQKKLAYLLTLKKPISEIILELHGSDFLVNFELFQLYEKNIVEVLDTVPPYKEETSPAKLFNRGLELMAYSNYKEAIATFQEVLRLDPQNEWASEQIDQAEKALCQEYYRSTIPGSKTPYFLIPDSSLTRYNLSHEEGFIASRINGTWDVKSIVMLSPLREIEILQVLEKFLKLELIALK
jgi:tetratricopeptide (TPR) repeat protein